MTMQDWARSTHHPTKRKLRWALVVLAWLAVGLWVTVMLVCFYQAPVLLIVPGAFVAAGALSALVEWIFEKDKT